MAFYLLVVEYPRIVFLVSHYNKYHPVRMSYLTQVGKEGGTFCIRDRVRMYGYMEY